MAGPAEILIVVGVFLLVGVYLYIASRFLRADKPDNATPEETKTAARTVPPFASRKPREARAH
jgi:hypothetical protein